MALFLHCLGMAILIRPPFGATQNREIYALAAAEANNALVVAKYKMHRQGIGRKCLANIRKTLSNFHDCV